MVVYVFVLFLDNTNWTVGIFVPEFLVLGSRIVVYSVNVWSQESID